MDEATKTLLDNFIQFISQEIGRKDKKYKHFEISKYALHAEKVTVTYFLDGQSGELFFDLRELKDNQNHFGHLLGSALDQLARSATHS